jgi:hypothetical protein
MMTRDFDKCKFELIDKVIENLGDLAAADVPKDLTAVVVPCEQQTKKAAEEQKEKKETK